MLLISFRPSLAQDSGSNSVFTIMTFKTTIPEGGSRAEFAELMKQWTEKVTKKNDKILSERVMRHLSGSDSRDLVIVTEYASWNDVEAAQDKQGELVKAGWPDEEKRKAYNKKLNSYLGNHSDEIFSEISDWRK